MRSLRRETTNLDVPFYLLSFIFAGITKLGSGSVNALASRPRLLAKNADRLTLTRINVDVPFI
jgi:hypothetical protein